jgi:hypothetical protein
MTASGTCFRPTADAPLFLDRTRTVIAIPMSIRPPRVPPTIPPIAPAEIPLELCAEAVAVGICVGAASVELASGVSSFPAVGPLVTIYNQQENVRITVPDAVGVG